MAITRGFNRGPIQQRGMARMPSANPRAIAALTAFAQASKTGPMNFDQLYRHLVEGGFQPNEAHLAVESFVRSARGKR
jgi:hypothetical protein